MKALSPTAASALRWFLRELAEALKWTGIAFGAPYYPEMFRVPGSRRRPSAERPDECIRQPGMLFFYDADDVEPFDIATWEDKLL